MTLVLIIAVICIIVSAAIVIINLVRTSKLMKSLDNMLDLSMSGDFTENTFDESRLSALECKMAHYLTASEVSAKNLNEERNKIKTLISDISHQTKTPIANIQLYSELLLENIKDDDLENISNAQAIKNQTQKLAFLISTLVKLSRLETGILVLKPELNKINCLLENINEQLGAKALQKGLKFNVIFSETRAVFDEKWTSEALCNIVDNAIKYTDNGGITIKVTEYEMFVCILIEDTGMGISEDEQAKIFTRFYRGENARDSEGVGIGLYLAREIVSGEGGYIKVASEKGQGARFYMYLPK